MSGRHLHLVAYDVREKKRLRAMHKTMCGFGDPIQYSVFCCELSDAERELMITAISERIHHKEDRVLIADLGARGRRARRSLKLLGRNEPVPERAPVIF